MRQGGDMLLKLTRKQFPSKLYFTMIDNQLQGPTLGIVVLNLWTTVFTYGQLYVLISHVTNGANLAVLYTFSSPVVMQYILFPELLLY